MRSIAVVPAAACFVLALALASPARAVVSASDAADTVVQASVVQIIETWRYAPSSPDPSGIAYDAAQDRFIITDSEVNETAIYQGKNIFTATRTGSGVGTGTTLPASQEPAGAGFDAVSRTLYVADDDRDRIFSFRPGADGVHGTADDSISSFSSAAFGSTDSEGVEYDSASGHLFVADGAGIRIYDVDPVNGVFGDGDDVVTSFSVGAYGARDAEGIGSDPRSGNLIVIDPSTKSIYELTTSGGLVRIIDCRGIPTTNKNLAGVTMAPTSDPNDDPSRLSYWVVDRQVDNGSDPNENDGLLYELVIPSADAPPTVSLTAPAQGATVAGTTLVAADAADDTGVAQVRFAVDGTTIGTDADGADGWSVSWNTTSVADGSHTVTAVATDTGGQSASDARTVTVDNVDSPPTVSLDAPAEGATISGSVLVQAAASDDKGVARVQFAVDGVPVGTDENGADGWSVSWNSASTSDGARTVTATATDTVGQTASDSNAVTVDNTPPSAAVTAPAAGSTLAGTVSLVAAANDNIALASVAFLVSGAPVGTDTDGADGWSVAWNTTTVPDGAYEIAAVAADRAGNATTSAAVAVLVDNPDTVVLDSPVATGVDDAEEWPDGSVWRTQGDLELGFDKPRGVATTVGLRFAGIAIPQGATITNAYVQFQVDEKGKDATSLTIRAENSDEAAPITTAPFAISSRPQTASSVAWQPPQWLTVGAAGPDQRTPDLSDVIQEVVDRQGWSSGNAVLVVVTGTGRRTAESFEGRAPPILHVEYSRP